MDRSLASVRRHSAAILAAMAVVSVTSGVAIAAVIHSTVWSAPPAILGFLAYGVFARRAMRLWQGPAVSCLHSPPCWHPAGRADRPAVMARFSGPPADEERDP